MYTETSAEVAGTPHAQVIGEYRKARALMAGGAATAKGGVWQNLFHEVEKVQPSPHACVCGVPVEFPVQPHHGDQTPTACSDMLPDQAVPCRCRAWRTWRAR